MNEKPLLKWGGICAFVFVILFVIVDVLLLISQGIPTRPPTVSEFAGLATGIYWKALVPVMCINFCIYLVVVFAAYDYLKKANYAMARVGLGFGILLIIVIFIEMALIGGLKIIANVDASGYEKQLFSIFILFGVFHIFAIWFHGLFSFFWGFGFVRLKGKAKAIGVLFLAFSFFYVLFYLFLRVGNIMIAELAHHAGHVALIVSHILLGIVLLKASKEVSISQ